MSSSGRNAVALSLAALALGPGFALGQQIAYVNAAADPGGDGLSWETAYRDLQDGLGAGWASQVWVAQGTYRADRGFVDRSATFHITLRSVYGGFAGSEVSLEQRDPVTHPTILSGDLLGDDGPGFANYADNTILLVTIGPGSLLDGFTLRGASGGAGVGSAVSLSGGTIRNCTLTQNQGVVDPEGGALSYTQGAAGPAVVDGCRFVGNRKLNGLGGAVFMQGPTGLTISNSVFGSNTASGTGGGAIFGGPVLNNCTFDSNTAPATGAMGGAVFGASGLITGCAFVNNSAALGGAVYTRGQSGDLLVNCSFTGNHASDGGAIYFSDGDSVVRGCVFSANQAVRGGAVASVNSNPVMIGSTFLQNHGFYGGGARFDGGRPVVLNCRLLGNDTSLPNTSGGVGGGLYLTNSTLTSLTDVIFSGNSADTFGGAVAGEMLYGNGAVTNCTFSLNHAGMSGGGLFVVGPVGLAISNSILWGNSDLGGAGVSAQLTGGAPHTVRYCTLQGWNGSPAGPGNTGTDPMLMNPPGPDGIPGTPDDDVHLPRFSPATDSADAGALPRDVYDLNANHNFNEPVPFDADGQARQRDDFRVPNTGTGPGPALDRGALEFQPPDCYANCDESTTPPVLNVNDFLCFQFRFVGGDSYANCDGSTTAPVLNVNDFACFVNAFAGGCP